MSKVTPGRPRNDLADRRIHEAALALYGDAGWHGFNLTKVAALAGVGKSSMYARWTERDALLLDAFRTLVVPREPMGQGPTDILVNEIAYRLDEYLGPHRLAVRRVFVEFATAEDPVIGTIYHHVYIDPIARLRSRLWDFKSRGDLPSDVSVTRLLDAVEGSVLMRTFCLRAEDVECFRTEIGEYAESLVDDLLGHVTVAPQRRLHAL